MNSKDGRGKLIFFSLSFPMHLSIFVKGIRIPISLSLAERLKVWLVFGTGLITNDMWILTCSVDGQYGIEYYREHLKDLICAE